MALDTNGWSRTNFLCGSRSFRVKCKRQRRLDSALLSLSLVIVQTKMSSISKHYSREPYIRRWLPWSSQTLLPEQTKKQCQCFAISTTKGYVRIKFSTRKMHLEDKFRRSNKKVSIMLGFMDFNDDRILRYYFLQFGFIHIAIFVSLPRLSL